MSDTPDIPRAALEAAIQAGRADRFIQRTGRVGGGGTWDATWDKTIEAALQAAMPHLLAAGAGVTDIPDAAIDALTGALATASGVPGATAGDCYRAGLAAAVPYLRLQVDLEALTPKGVRASPACDHEAATRDLSGLRCELLPGHTGPHQAMIPAEWSRDG